MIDRQKLAYALWSSNVQPNNDPEFWKNIVTPPPGDTRWQGVLAFYLKKADAVIDYMNEYDNLSGESK